MNVSTRHTDLNQTFDTSTERRTMTDGTKLYQLHMYQMLGNMTFSEQLGRKEYTLPLVEQKLKTIN